MDCRVKPGNDEGHRPPALKSVTAAPSAANTRAVARPMPPAAPVTRTVNPLTDRLSCLKSDMNHSLELPCDLQD